VDRAQYIASSYSDALLDGIGKGYKESSVLVAQQLLKSLSWFDSDLVDFDPGTIPLDLRSLIAVYRNFLQRGTPSHTSTLVEDYLTEKWGHIARVHDDTGGFSYSWNEPMPEHLGYQLYLALFVVDPRVDTKVLRVQDWNALVGSNLERDFLRTLVQVKDEHWWLQLLEPQRNLTNILEVAFQEGEHLSDLHRLPLKDFHAQKVDFALESPVMWGEESRVGLVVEIDGSQHLRDPGQTHLDIYRDKVLKTVKAMKWSVLRLASGERGLWPDQIQNVNTIWQDKYFEGIRRNVASPLYATAQGRMSLSIALTPMLATRIQRILLELVAQGKLDLTAHRWKIGILERDVDGARIALSDFRQRWDTFCGLAGLVYPLPPVELEVYATEEFLGDDPVADGKRTMQDAVAFEGDLFLDVSMLQRPLCSDPMKPEGARESFFIRSSWSRRLWRSFSFEAPVTYPALLNVEADPNNDDMERIDLLRGLMQDVFRKRDFRPGQLPILSRALQRESVIGLLSTGGGKSLTYQLCSLLQPGLTVVVDPIKSLMQDQDQGLRRNGIDATVFINSSIRTYYEREWAQSLVREGRVLFAFISPERYQIARFRDVLKQMAMSGHWVHQCVIDEAHCVSEWGHDFRTSYLKLGDNARTFSPELKEMQATLFGLTATASYDVLSDVKRELGVGEESIVSSLSAHREELIYKIIPVDADISQARSPWQDSEAVGNAKVEALRSFLKGLPHNLKQYGLMGLSEHLSDPEIFFNNIRDKNGKYETGVLVFSPVKSDKHPLGVRRVAATLQANYSDTGTFYGGDANIVNDESLSEKNQRNFIDNKLNILVATKAFGMGIDKPNVRATVHLNFPSSMEAFVQEAGRAGRDRKRAICVILYARVQGHDRGVNDFFHESNFRGAQRDFQIFCDLLEKITFPMATRKDWLENQVFDQVGEEVEVGYWKMNGLTRLYVNKAFQESYGYIDLNLGSFNINTTGRHADIPEQVGVETMDCVQNILKKQATISDMETWLKQGVRRPPEAGIEILLGKTEPGKESSQVVIGFHNDAATELTRLYATVNGDVTLRQVETALGQAEDVDEFREKLKRTLERNARGVLSASWDENILEDVRKLFNSARLEGDTFKAVYRLSILGVVDDYEVDYNEGVIHARLIKRDDAFYLKRLEEYLLRYISPNKVADELARVQQSGERTMIRKCGRVLIDFVYQHIAAKRREAINEMERFCEKGLGMDDPDVLAREIELYFNSRYIPDMLEKTKDGAEFDMSLVKEYIDLTAGVTDNLEHLRGSSSRILSDHPDNGALLMLRGFSVLLLETRYTGGHLVIRNKTLVDRGLQDLELGVYAFQRLDGTGSRIFLLVRDALIVQNPGLQTMLETLYNYYSVRRQREWLQSFNKRYITSS
jgi:RecQ family ATP-dependent DNA helicase